MRNDLLICIICLFAFKDDHKIITNLEEVFKDLSNNELNGFWKVEIFKDVAKRCQILVVD